MSHDNIKTIAGWLGIIAFYVAMILLAGFLAGAVGGCENL